MIVFADLSQMRMRAEVDERFVHLIRLGQEAYIYGRGLGDKRYRSKIALIKPLMGNKTVFSRASGERKDLNVLEVLVQPESPLNVPIGLQIEVDIQLVPQPSGPDALPPADVIGSDDGTAPGKRAALDRGSPIAITVARDFGYSPLPSRHSEVKDR